MAFAPMEGNFCTGLEGGNIPWSSTDYSNCAIDATTPHTGVYGIKQGAVDNVLSWWRMRPGLISDVYIGLWRWPSINLINSSIISIQAVLTDGKVIEVRLTSGVYKTYVDGTLVAIGAVVITAAQWHNVQVHFVIANAGSVALVVEGIAETVYSGDTQPGASDQIEFIYSYMYGGGGNYCFEDDIVVGTGGWPGDLRADGIKPNADTATVQWSLSAGVDTYALIDEVPADDADYIYTGTDGQQSIVELENWSAAGKTPQFVVQRWRAKKSEAGAEQIKLIDTDGVTTNVDAGHDVQTDETYIDKVQMAAPDGTPWTPAHVNGLDIGVESSI